MSQAPFLEKVLEPSTFLAWETAIVLFWMFINSKNNQNCNKCLYYIKYVLQNFEYISNIHKFDSFKEFVIEYNTDCWCLFSRISQATFRLCSRMCLTQARFLLENFCEYEKLFKQDSCLSQALLLDSSKNYAWIKQDSCLSALVITIPGMFMVI